MLPYHHTPRTIFKTGNDRYNVVVYTDDLFGEVCVCVEGGIMQDCLVWIITLSNALNLIQVVFFFFSQDHKLFYNSLRYFRC